MIRENQEELLDIDIMYMYLIDTLPFDYITLLIPIDNSKDFLTLKEVKMHNLSILFGHDLLNFSPLCQKWEHTKH